MNIECTICMAVSHKTEDHTEWVKTRLSIFQREVEAAQDTIEVNRDLMNHAQERILKGQEEKAQWLAKIENLKKEEAER